MRDGYEVAADLSDPEVFDNWLRSESTDTLEEWALNYYGERRRSPLHSWIDRVAALNFPRRCAVSADVWDAMVIEGRALARLSGNIDWPTAPKARSERIDLVGVEISCDESLPADSIVARP